MAPDPGVFVMQPQPRRPQIRNVSFEVLAGELVRHVVPARGKKPYTQTCSLEVFKTVALHIDPLVQQGVTTGELWAALPDAPRTQISVALEFLKERGCVRTWGGGRSRRRRRCTRTP